MLTAEPAPTGLGLGSDDCSPVRTEGPGFRARRLPLASFHLTERIRVAQCLCCWATPVKGLGPRRF